MSRCSFDPVTELWRDLTAVRELPGAPRLPPTRFNELDELEFDISP